MSKKSGIGKLISKVHKIHDPLDLDNKLLDPLGLPSLHGKENGLLQDEPEAVTGSVATAPATPTAVSDETLEAREAQRKRQLAAAGMGGTVLTGSSGLASAAPTSGKSLLGS